MTIYAIIYIYIYIHLSLSLSLSIYLYIYIYIYVYSHLITPRAPPPRLPAAELPYIVHLLTIFIIIINYFKILYLL